MSAKLMGLVLSSCLLVTTSSGWADTVEASSHVSAATIFSDRALVTRDAKVHVTAGPHTISVTDLPAGFDESTLRVQGKAASAVKIGTVEVKHIFLTDAANAAEREKQTALDSKNNEKLLLAGEIKALETKELFISRIVDNGADNHTVPNTSKLDFTPEKWVQALNFLQTGMMETQKELALHHIAMQKIDAEIAKLQADLDQVKTTQAKQRRDAYINIEASQDTELQLSLNYQTHGASWRPIYDARLDTNTNMLDLEQYGQVMQTTGEDWADVNVVLSTTQPANGSEMPRLYEWIIRIIQPIVYGNLKGGSNLMALDGSSGNIRAQKALGAPAPTMMLQRQEQKDSVAEVPAAPEQAIVQSSEYAAEFHVPGNVNLKSIKDPTKLFITASKIKAELTAETSPRLSAQAYLFTKVTNNEEYPFLSGTIAKYRDGAFIGNASLQFLRPKETTSLSFGIDDRIKVLYQKKHETIDNPTLVVMGDVKLDRQYETKITNLHKDPVPVTVYEQYPVSNDPDVKSEINEDETTAGYAADKDNRQGVIFWSGSINPKEEKIFDLGFRVKYPKDKQINGL